ncbi:MAG TPA: hypothetical protein VH592_16655 [Gemmataceae bacterium]|jgi:hypothetical protein
MFRLRLTFVWIPALAFFWVLATAFAHEPPADKKAEKPPTIAPPTEQEVARKRMRFMKTALARYTVHVSKQKEAATVLDPCLRWSNPISGVPDGILAVYALNGGRPAAIAQFFQNGPSSWVNEFTIIPESDVTIQRSDALFWKPSEYVCKFTELPRSPAPAVTPALRLTQMRDIAADFSAIDYFGYKETKEDLRLLRQPVYRYSEKVNILDGAVFVFALGTNPECCVLLEACRNNNGSSYRYAVAPMSIYQLEVCHKGRLVWEIGRREPAGANSRSYYAGGYTPEPGESLPK